MIDKVKIALRIKSDAFNEEIQSLIDACKTDLRLAGVDNISETDELVARAVIFYCRAYFFVGDAATRYEQAYQNLKIALSLSGDYRAGGDGNV